MDDLVAFLRARLDEDERVAREALSDTGGPVWSDGGQYGESVNVDETGGPVAVGAWTGYLGDGPRYHIARHDPARVLAEVAAHRAWVDWIDGELADDAAQQMPWDLACALAAVYASHPDYREEWRL